YRLNVGYGTDAAHLTGSAAATGFAVPKNPPLQTLRTYLFGDATVGARGLPTASLDTYFAAAYIYDFLGFDPGKDATPFATAYDADHGRALLVRSAYAEYDAAQAGGAPVWLRAGRQFRMGAGIAHFDGVSLGWEGPPAEVSGFVGQRVALWSDERTGLVGGGAVRAD